MNKKELQGVMIVYGDTQATLAEHLGISRVWLNSKINERKGAVFTQPEMQAIKKRYSLSKEKFIAIFFTY